MNFLKTIFKGDKQRQSVGAILYPDKIIIETQDQVKDGFWIVTDRISILPPDSEDEQLGENIIRHLELSKVNVPNPKGQEGFKKIRDNYKKATGLKTQKAQMDRARYLSIARENNKFEFSPTANGGASGEQRGYRYKPEENVEISQSMTPAELGQQVRMLWLRCE
jgi:hypothetical protein